jgi:transcriptional regulator of acetoin/glycerol metabolism
LTVHDRLTVEDLPDQVRQAGGAGPIPGVPEAGGQILPLEEVERRYLRQVLEQLGGNRTLAAKLLGVDRKTLYRKLKES